MEQPWYRQYFWLLIFGGIIIITAVISFLMVCFCKTQLSRSLTRRFQRTLKRERNLPQVHNVPVITENSVYQPGALPTIILPKAPDHLYATIAEQVTKSQDMYATVKKEKSNLHVPNKDDRYSSASYDSVGHITAIDYINTSTESFKKDLGYIDVLPDDDDDTYDDVEII